MLKLMTLVLAALVLTLSAPSTGVAQVCGEANVRCLKLRAPVPTWTSPVTVTVDGRRLVVATVSFNVEVKLWQVEDALVAAGYALPSRSACDEYGARRGNREWVVCFPQYNGAIQMDDEVRIWAPVDWSGAHPELRSKRDGWRPKASFLGAKE